MTAEFDRPEIEELDKESIARAMAPFFHNLWWEWSNSIAQEEDISEDRLERWREYWKPYELLDENTRQSDIERAEAFVEYLERLGEL